MASPRDELLKELQNFERSNQRRAFLNGLAATSVTLFVGGLSFGTGGLASKRLEEGVREPPPVVDVTDGKQDMNRVPAVAENVAGEVPPPAPPPVQAPASLQASVGGGLGMPLAPVGAVAVAAAAAFAVRPNPPAGSTATTPSAAAQLKPLAPPPPPGQTTDAAARPAAAAALATPAATTPEAGNSPAVPTSELRAAVRIAALKADGAAALARRAERAAALEERRQRLSAAVEAEEAQLSLAEGSVSGGEEADAGAISPALTVDPTAAGLAAGSRQRWVDGELVTTTEAPLAPPPPPEDTPLPITAPLEQKARREGAEAAAAEVAEVAAEEVAAAVGEAEVGEGGAGREAKGEAVRAPMRLLVVGEVGDGKSTLINALRDEERSSCAEAGKAGKWPPLESAGVAGLDARGVRG